MGRGRYAVQYAATQVILKSARESGAQKFRKVKMPTQLPSGEDDRQAFVGSLLVDFQSQAAFACRGWPTLPPLDPNSLCNAALTRVLNAMYRTFDREREGSADFCRRAFAVAIRDELVERRRRRAALKRGGGYCEQPFDIVVDVLEARHGPLTDLTDAIEDIRRSHPVRADIVTMRVYGSFTFREIAAELGLDESTVRKHFKLAQAQLWRLFRPGVT